MASTLTQVLMCIRHAHDQRLLIVAGLVCAVGTYASFALASHAIRSRREGRRVWAPLSIAAAGCTAWATHFIVLLGFRPGMPAAFDPGLTALSLFAAVLGIGAGMVIGLRQRRSLLRFGAGLILGAGIAALHYIGQAAYLVQGQVAWDPRLVLLSVVISLPLAGLAMLVAGRRKRLWRYMAVPFLLAAIAILHFCGMAAMTLHFDPQVQLPARSVLPATITPVVASIAIGLLILAVFGMRFDIAARARVRWERRRLGELAGVALEGLLICDGDSVVAANHSVERLSGRAAGHLVGSCLSSLLPGLDVPSMPEREEREAELIAADGQPIPVRVLRSEMLVGRKRQTIVAVRDQRERIRTEARMRTLAFRDALTGLPNRTRFFDLLTRQASSGRERDEYFSILMIDLGRFKQVNDTLGHAMGDLLLRKVADRLGSIVREGDVLARLGGDEFAILQVDTRSPEAANDLAGRIVETVGGLPFFLEGQCAHVGASVGIACSPIDGDDPAELLRDADLALYAAKSEGKGRFRRYDVALDEGNRRRRELEEGLRRALAVGQFEVHYQPLVDADTGQITSAEALVRWRHPRLGLVPPSDFIALAEETGLILPLGEWVLRTACIEAMNWPEGMSIAVNLSPVQFRDQSLANVVEAALATSGLDPSRLELEITEGVLLTDEKEVLDTLTRLKAKGVRISMDDFGTGYSSLSYLRRFPFDKIKIDQSFVRHAPEDAECASIIRAIITMGRCLGMTTTIEGVETQEQHDFSVQEGCHMIQGYHVSRPLTADNFALFCSEWENRGVKLAA